MGTWRDGLVWAGEERIARCLPDSSLNNVNREKSPVLDLAAAMDSAGTLVNGIPHSGAIR
jgi:hypothetical protein